MGARANEQNKIDDHLNVRNHFALSICVSCFHIESAFDIIFHVWGDIYIALVSYNKYEILVELGYLVGDFGAQLKHCAQKTKAKC